MTPLESPVCRTTMYLTEAWKRVKSSQNFFLPKVKHPKPYVSENELRVVCLSDTHDEVPFCVPDGDVLLHAGDFTRSGTYSETKAFNRWLGTLPHRYKVVIAGNHEYLLDPYVCDKDGPADPKYVLNNAIYLQDSSITIAGIKVYGAPWTPVYRGYAAFDLFRGPDILAKWQQIPSDTDVLVTHGPPLGRCDFVPRKKVHAGCEDLLREVQSRVRPMYHVFGHIHEGYGMTSDGNTTFVNAAFCDAMFRPANLPLVLDIPIPKGHSKT